jgi:hypothetical protein
LYLATARVEFWVVAKPRGDLLSGFSSLLPTVWAMRHLAIEYTITQQIRSYRVVVRIKSKDVIIFGCAQNTLMRTTTTDSRMKIFICLDWQHDKIIVRHLSFIIFVNVPTVYKKKRRRRNYEETKGCTGFSHFSGQDIERFEVAI